MRFKSTREMSGTPKAYKTDDVLMDGAFVDIVLASMELMAL